MKRRDLLYFGRFFETSGYAAEARSYALGLSRLGYRIKLLTLPERFPSRDLLDPAELADLEAMAVAADVDPARAVALLHQKPDTFPATDCHVTIARTAFETDRLPAGWAERLNALTEVWVPSRFNLESFAAGGVRPEKLRWIRQGIDTRRFRPDAPPSALPGRRGFTFLSAFTWQDRKGWDVLLRAYLTEFHPDDDVSLVIWAQPFYRRPCQIAAEMRQLIEGELKLDPARIPHVTVTTTPCPDSAMPGLYTACDAFVLPTRGEGWGRPFAEAMACARPVIGTAWGGNLDFMSPANSYLLATDGLAEVNEGVEIADFRGHRWANPSVSHLRQLMRHVVTHPAEAVKKGLRARADMVTRWDLRHTVAELAAALYRYYP